MDADSPAAHFFKAFQEKVLSPDEVASIKAILVISAHTESSPLRVSGGTNPSLLFDYYGFPRHTYELKYPAPGDPALAARVASLLQGVGPTEVDAAMQWDHGTFIPLMLMFPAATVPVVQLSLSPSLDPAFHTAMGEALAPLRDEGVLIVGSGFATHNMAAGRTGATDAATSAVLAWHDWLVDTVVGHSATSRLDRLHKWETAPSARTQHPREEHLVPLMVVAGAGGEGKGKHILDYRAGQLWDFSSFRIG
jgi:aromatic ring-opening dioxygenase catalytic subunit (LigB family)